MDGYIKAMLYDIFTKVKPASSGHTRIATNGFRTTSTKLSRFCSTEIFLSISPSYLSSPQHWPSSRTAGAGGGGLGHQQAAQAHADAQAQAHAAGGGGLGQAAQDPFVLVGSDLDTMVHEIHAELGRELQVVSDMLPNIFLQIYASSG